VQILASTPFGVRVGIIIIAITARRNNIDIKTSPAVVLTVVRQLTAGTKIVAITGRIIAIVVTIDISHTMSPARVVLANVRFGTRSTHLDHNSLFRF